MVFDDEQTKVYNASLIAVNSLIDIISDGSRWQHIIYSQTLNYGHSSPKERSVDHKLRRKALTRKMTATW